MSTYVMSDIHGCYDIFIKMLERIKFCDEDRLILAGDYIDRGLQNREMLDFICKCPENVELLKGNHDLEFAYYVKLLEAYFEKNGLNERSINDIKDAYLFMKNTAKKNGVSYFDSYNTILYFIELYGVTLSKLKEWANPIFDLPYYKALTINNKNYIIVHAGFIEDLKGGATEIEYASEEEFYIYAREDAYKVGGAVDSVIISGHTPTNIEGEFCYNDGMVFKFYNEKMNCTYYNIDCGCAYRKRLHNGKLACIRLEDEKIFYV